MEYVNLKEMTWKEADVRMKEIRATIPPLGSTEQRGYHTTVDTGNIVVDHVAGLLARAADCVVLPVLNYGQAWSTRDFPATVSLSEKTYTLVIKDIVVSLEKEYKNIILFSDRWGNVAPCKLTVRELLNEYGFRNVHYLGYADLRKNGKRIMGTELWSGNGLYTVGIETSALFHIRPDSMKMGKAICEYPEIPLDVDIRPIPWTEFAESGIFGDAPKTTAEKGKQFLDNWIRQMYRLVIDSIHS